MISFETDNEASQFLILGEKLQCCIGGHIELSSCKGTVGTVLDLLKKGVSEMLSLHSYEVVQDYPFVSLVLNASAVCYWIPVSFLCILPSFDTKT